MDELDAALDKVVAEFDGEDNDETVEVESPEPDETAEIEAETPTPEGDDAEAEPEDQDEDDESVPDDDARILEIEDEDVVLQLPDGTKFPLKNGALRQADYTRKTQALAEEKRAFEQEREQFEASKGESEELLNQVETWFEEKTADPASWATEIIGGTDNPTHALAVAIKSLADQDALDPEFLETFGLTGSDSPVVGKAEQSEAEQRIARLEAQLEQQGEAERLQAERQQTIREYFDTFDQLTQLRDIEFPDAQAESDLRRDTVRFAIENGIPDLEVALDVVMARKGTASPSKSSAPARVPDTKKRATRAMQPRSSTSSSTPKTSAKSLDEAAEMALDGWATGR